MPQYIRQPISVGNLLLDVGNFRIVKQDSQPAARAQARNLAVVMVLLRRPPLDGERRWHANNLSATFPFSHVEILARRRLRDG